MLIIATAITFVLTTVLSMAGVGAAFVLIPVFLALGVELHAAMATALLLNTVGMGVASVTFIRKGLVEWRLVLPMLVVAVAAAPVGVAFGRGLDRALLLWLFVAFLVFASLMLLLYRPKPRAARTSTAAAPALGIPVGAIAGFVGGLLGVGGGNIILPALVTAGLEPKRASASAAFVVVFASFAGFLANARMAQLGLELLGATAAATAVGATLGAWLASEKLRADQLKRVIALVLLAVAVKTAWSLL